MRFWIAAITGLAGGAVTGIALGPFAAPQPRAAACMPLGHISDWLQDLGEEPLYAGSTGEGDGVLLFSNGRQNWSLVTVDADGRSCLVLHGDRGALREEQ